MHPQDTPVQLPLFPEKRCSGPCGRLLRLEAFGRHKKAKDGLNWWCKQCNAANARAHYAAHRQEKIVYQQTYYAANKDAINAAHRAKRRALRVSDPAAWHAANQEHYRRYGGQSTARARLWHARHRDRVLLIRRASYRRHLEQHLVGAHRRRVRLRRIEGRWTAGDIALIYEVQRGQCTYCLAPLGQAFHRDHMIPIVRPESSNWPHNLCLCCARCNRRKHALDAGQFLARLVKERRAARRALGRNVGEQVACCSVDNRATFNVLDDG